MHLLLEPDFPVYINYTLFETSWALLQKSLRLETGLAVHGIGIDIQVLAVIQKAIHIPIILIKKF